MVYNKGFRPQNTKKIYNCDPSRERGYIFNGEDAKVPPLGHPDNPQEWPIAVVDHIMHHDTSADSGTKGWLTTDEKVYQDRLNFYEKNGYVINLMDRNVISNPKEGGVLTFTQQQMDALDAARLQKVADRMAGKQDATPAEEPEKKRGRPAGKVTVRATNAEA